MANKQQSEIINGVIGEVDKVKDAVNEVKTKYEPKSYDYSSVASTLSIVTANGGQQASITPPAGVATVPTGAYTKIVITPPGTPQETPGDDDQVTLNGSFLWINKTNTDIMQWKEIKTHVANGDIMVIERLADSGGFKNFQLVRWIDASKASSGGGSLELISQQRSIIAPQVPLLEIVDIPFDSVRSVIIDYILPENFKYKRAILTYNAGSPNPMGGTFPAGWGASVDDGSQVGGGVSAAKDLSTGKFKFTFGIDKIQSYTITYWKEA